MIKPYGNARAPSHRRHMAILNPEVDILHFHDTIVLELINEKLRKKRCTVLRGTVSHRVIDKERDAAACTLMERPTLN